jgi:hypothetical protein
MMTQKNKNCCFFCRPKTKKKNGFYFKSGRKSAEIFWLVNDVYNGSTGKKKGGMKQVTSGERDP